MLFLSAIIVLVYWDATEIKGFVTYFSSILSHKLNLQSISLVSLYNLSTSTSGLMYCTSYSLPVLLTLPYHYVVYLKSGTSHERGLSLYSSLVSFVVSSYFSIIKWCVRQLTLKDNKICFATPLCVLGPYYIHILSFYLFIYTQL